MPRPLIIKFLNCLHLCEEKIISKHPLRYPSWNKWNRIFNVRDPINELQLPLPINRAKIALLLVAKLVWKYLVEVWMTIHKISY